jgi:predicted branched-subunit amino acid permease
VTATPKSRLASLRAEALAVSRRPAFREGARDGLPMAIGIAAWGLVAGVAMAKSGMGVGLAIFMSVLVYAGSAQIAALPLIAAGAPMWVVWATTLCVSLRFMAFSFHYRPYFAHLPRPQRVALSFLMGDTNFALFIRRFPSSNRGTRTRTTSSDAPSSRSGSGSWPSSPASSPGMASPRPGASVSRAPWRSLR